MTQIRLDKYLADMGIGTRSQIKEEIRKGAVLVNNKITKKSECKIEIGKDCVIYQGQLISYIEWEYIMLYKPAGVLSATRDKSPTVLDLLKDKKRKDLFPVGRLDKDTEGLLLITNDGELAHQLLSPRKHIPKLYYVRVMGLLTQQMVQRFQKGIELEEGMVFLPAQLNILNINPNTKTSEAEITIYEGKYHQVKRMFQAVGCEVSYLKRLAMGNLFLDTSLKKGEYRYLTTEEIEYLKNR